MLSLVSLFSFVALSAVVIGPRLLRGSTQSPAPAALSDRFARQQTVLEGLLDKASVVLAVHTGESSPAALDSLVLWLADDRYPGEVNLSEVLVVRFSPMLRTIMACTWTPLLDDDIALTRADFADVHRLEALANRLDVVRAVVAQPIGACEITGMSPSQSLRSDATSGVLGLRLTWIDDSADTREVSMIRTDLHLRAPDGRF